MQNLTGRQEKILAKLWYFDQIQKKSPSIREVKNIMEVKSNQSAADMLDRLEKDGWIQKDERKARSITLTQKARDYLVGIGANQVINHYASLAGNNLRTIDAERVDTTQPQETADFKNSYIHTPIQDEKADLRKYFFKRIYSFLDDAGTGARQEVVVRNFMFVPLVLLCMGVLFFALLSRLSVEESLSTTITLTIVVFLLFFVYRKGLN